MSKRVYLLGAGAALVALALAFTDWALSLQPGVTEANARRIRPGMPVSEVKMILGGTANCIEVYVPHKTPTGQVENHIVRLFQETSRGCVWVEFDADDRAKAVRWEPSPTTPPGLLSRLRTWLGW
jgi:hypothetical protein